jgi:hypothetical protein
LGVVCWLCFGLGRVGRGVVLYSDRWRLRGKIDWTVLVNHKFSLAQKDLTADIT